MAVGAIAFMSTISLSSSSSLNVFTERWYQNLSYDLYGEGVGKINKETVGEVEDCCNNIPHNMFVASEMTLHGDPALRLNPHNKPDYVITDELVRTIPASISAELGEFEL